MIDLYSLKYFYDSCRLASMTKAAEMNFVTRPAVSQAIMKLEKSLGVELLEHKRRTFTITEHGYQLMEKAAEIFKQIENIDSVMKSNLYELSGYLVIGIARSLATHHFDIIVKNLKLRFPNLTFKIKIDNSEGLIRLLDSKNADLIIFLGDNRLSGCIQKVIKKGYFNLIKPKAINTTQLTFAITEKRPETERLKNLYEIKFNKKLPVFAEIPSWDAIQHWINNESCGGLVPDFISESYSKINTVLISKVLPYEIKVMYSESRAADRRISELLKEIISAFENK